MFIWIMLIIYSGLRVMQVLVSWMVYIGTFMLKIDPGFFIVDPIFPLVFLINSWIPGMFDVVFQTTFIATLMLFWLCLYHGIRQVRLRFQFHFCYLFSFVSFSLWSWISVSLLFTSWVWFSFNYLLRISFSFTLFTYWFQLHFPQSCMYFNSTLVLTF